MRKSQIAILLVVLVLLASALAACGSSATPAPAGVSNPVLSTDKAGANTTTTFAPTDTIYLSFDINQVDKGTSFDIKWYALNVSGQDPNTPFVTSNVVYDGTSGNKVYANTNSTSGGFPVGQYKVEIDMNGTKVAEQSFNIQ